MSEAAIASKPVAQMSATELREYVASLEQAHAETVAELAVTKAAIPATPVAFVPVVECVMREPGYDTNGRGFTLTQRKLEVTVTRKSGNPAMIRENVAVWTAILAHADEIRAALA